MQINIRQLSWFQLFKNVGYNVKYKAISYFQQVDKKNIIKNSQTAYMLGRTFNTTIANSTQINNAIYQHFNKTFWMTYRAIFPQLNGQNGQEYIADTGWGCMIRVGQMFIAQSLKLYFQLNQKYDTDEILSYFNDYDVNQLFSIQRIVKCAYEQYSIQPGKWYNPSQISYIIADLLKKSKQTCSLHAQKFKKLDILVFNNSSLFFDKIIKKMAGIKQICKCKKSLVICQKCNTTTATSLSIILLTRIGLEYPEKKYLKVLNKMMESRFFQGMIGGKPDKALYFLGRKNENYIYLDPHLVQVGVNKNNLNENRSTYFCNSFRMCKNTSIDPSIGIGYFLSDLKDIDQFYSFMIKIKNQYLEDFFFFLSIQTPQYIKNEEQEEEKKIKQQNVMLFEPEDSVYQNQFTFEQT